MTKLNLPIIDKGARIGVSGSNRAGCSPEHRELIQGSCGRDETIAPAPLTLDDLGRGPWPEGRGSSRVKLVGPPPPGRSPSGAGPA